MVCSWPAWFPEKKAVFIRENLEEVPVLEQLDEASRQHKDAGRWMSCDLLRDARNIIEHLVEPPFVSEQQPKPTALARIHGFLAGLLAFGGHKHQQAACRAKGTRYYGGSVHSEGNYLDIETHNGKVVSAWFRCLTLPFKQTEVDIRRANEQATMYEGSVPRIVGIEFHEGKS